VDLATLAEKLAAPVLTGVTGFVGAALNFKRRIDELEKDFKRHQEAIKEELTHLKSAWRMEIDDLKDELTAKIKELTAELKELDDTFERFCRASNADFANADEMRAFIEEQGRQWQQIQRTLGQIEGLMERANQQAQPRPLKR
jgi:chromosome segregation ATPase